MENLINLMEYFKIYDIANFNKIRVGLDNMNGFVIYDNIKHITKLYSFGISDDYSFGNIFAKEANDCECYLYDETKNNDNRTLPEINNHKLMKRVHRIKENISKKTSLEDFIKKNKDENNNKMFLKLDIEGEEWDLLEKTPQTVLEQFEQIAIEFHWLDNLNDVFKKIECMKKLTEKFIMYHAHANNNGFINNVGRVKVPTMLQISMIRKDLVGNEKITITNTSFPTNLDSPNNQNRPDLNLKFYPFKPYYISMTTIPSRLKNIKRVIDSLHNQTLKPKKIFINIPRRYMRFKHIKIEIPDLSEYDNVEIIRCVDYGSNTKFLPILLIDEVKHDDPVIVVDDDFEYDKNLALTLLDLNYRFPDSASCIFGVTNALFFIDGRWIINENTQKREPAGFRQERIGYVDVLEGFCSTCMKKKFFKEDVFHMPIHEAYSTDDIWFSGHIIKNGFSIVCSDDKTILHIPFQDNVDALNNKSDKHEKNYSIVRYFQEVHKIFLDK